MLTYISDQPWVEGGLDLITLNMPIGKLRTESSRDLPRDPQLKRVRVGAWALVFCSEFTGVLEATKQMLLPCLVRL